MGEWRPALAETMDRWAADFRAEGHQQGLEQGLEQGVRKTLRHLLIQKFGKLSPTIAEQIENANQYQLERWAQRVIDAEELVQVFGE